MRKFKWYDWIPIVGIFTTNWGSIANGSCHFETLSWGLWMLVSLIPVVIGLLSLLAWIF